MQNKMDNKKNKNVLIIAGVVAILISFYGGMLYGKTQTPVASNNNQGNFGQNGAGNRMRGGGGNVFGQILSKDANSITVELRTPGSVNNGTTGTAQTGTGSKIVFYTNKTSVIKTIDGTVNDLIVGEQISVSGTANTDGSVNASSVQIRPNTTKTPTTTQ